MSGEQQKLVFKGMRAAWDTEGSGEERCLINRKVNPPRRQDTDTQRKYRTGRRGGLAQLLHNSGWKIPEIEFKLK